VITPKEVYFEVSEFLASHGPKGVEYDNLDSLGKLELLMYLEDVYDITLPMPTGPLSLEEMVRGVIGAMGVDNE
jgi:hypothetical protein